MSFIYANQHKTSQKAKRLEEENKALKKTLGLRTKTIGKLNEQIEALEKSLKQIQVMAGHPDAAEGCRLIIKEVRKHS